MYVNITGTFWNSGRFGQAENGGGGRRVPEQFPVPFPFVPAHLLLFGTFFKSQLSGFFLQRARTHNSSAE